MADNEDKPATDEDHRNDFCDMCKKSKKRHVQPVVFCDDCRQFLCKECNTFHSNLDATKGHHVVTARKMPKSVTEKQTKYGPCQEHSQQMKDRYCHDHKSLICFSCCKTDHKQCHFTSVYKACQNIPKIEVNDLVEVLNTLKVSLQFSEKPLIANKGKLEEEKNKMLKEVEDEYQKTIAKFDVLYHNMKHEIRGEYQTLESNITEKQKSIRDITLQIDSSLEEIQDIQGKRIDTDVFLKAQKITSDINNYIIMMRELMMSMGEVHLEYNPDKHRRDVLSEIKRVGSVSTHRYVAGVNTAVPNISFRSTSLADSCGPQEVSLISRKIRSPAMLEDIQLRRQGSFSVRAVDDKDKCLINSIAIAPDGRKILLDYNNKTLKIFSNEMKLITAFKLDYKYYPLGIAVLSNHEAVVSLRDILFILDISDICVGIKRKVKLPFSFEVRSVTSYKDKLIAVAPVNPSSVKLIDTFGNVYWSTCSDEKGGKLFAYPNAVCCQTVGGKSVVIVTDNNNNTLTLLDADTGKIIARRQLKDKLPRGAAIDRDGNVYVCYSRTSEIAVLNRDLTEEKILLSRQDLSDICPEALLYDESTHKLIVSCEYDFAIFDCVDLFQVV